MEVTTPKQKKINRLKNKSPEQTTALTVTPFNKRQFIGIEYLSIIAIESVRRKIGSRKRHTPNSVTT
ncbi:MAG: hypothetical protein E6559_01630 [Pantoea sp.]|uniref:hypothetical protein n=1 Tax=Pantoea septica TaxID=472695 RepID=UPI002896BF41|nr:hypothetical protein [Pantoea septica]MDU6438608.1 hypothetical protein [Pantoea sp.]